MNSIAFLGQSKVGQVHVFLINNFVPTIISTPDIDQIINNFTEIGDAIAYSYDLNGHSFYQITFPTAMRSFLYDGTTQIWSEVQSSVEDTNRHLSSLGMSFNYETFVSDYASGNLYFLDPTTFTDNGYPIKREIITRHITQNGNEFGISQLYLNLDIGEGTQLPLAGSDPYISLQVSKDGGRTWGDPIPKSMGRSWAISLSKGHMENVGFSPETLSSSSPALIRCLSILRMVQLKSVNA